MDDLEIIMYSDGASRGNPGESSLGVYIETLGKEYGEYIGKVTNNEAEYRALLFGLQKIKEILGRDRAKETTVKCYLDSELVVKQLQHQYKVKHPTMKKYCIQLSNISLDFLKVTFTHIPREKNKKADSLANIALNKRKQEKFLT